MFTALVRPLKTAAKVICLSLFAVLFLSGVWVSGAIAMPTESANVAMSHAADEVDRIVGEGTSDRIEGKVKSDIGTVERSVGKVSGQVEGVTKQVEGKVKSDIGRTQAATENARDNVEDAAEGFIDSVKELFD